MKIIGVTISALALAVIVLLFVGNTEINNTFPFIHIERPLCIFGVIFIALGISCFYYQGKSDVKKEYLEKVEPFEKPKSDLTDIKE